MGEGSVLTNGGLILLQSMQTEYKISSENWGKLGKIENSENWGKGYLDISREKFIEFFQYSIAQTYLELLTKHLDLIVIFIQYT